MIEITYRCPQCEEAARQTLSGASQPLNCPGCGRAVSVAAEPVGGGRVDRCVVCHSRDLFVRKDFPQRLGVTIVVLGFAASCITWYYHQVILTFGVLFATALVDVLLYLLMSDVLECYRCHAQYRGAANLDEHGPFALETHEKHRQQAAREANQDQQQISTGST